MCGIKQVLYPWTTRAGDWHKVMKPSKKSMLKLLREGGGQEGEREMRSSSGLKVPREERANWVKAKVLALFIWAPSLSNTQIVITWHSKTQRAQQQWEARTHKHPPPPPQKKKKVKRDTPPPKHQQILNFHTLLKPDSIENYEEHSCTGSM